MYNIENHIIEKKATIKDALICLNQLSDRVLTLFVMEDKKMLGTVTDGDIRRALVKDIRLDDCVEKIMNTDFKYIHPKENDIQKIRTLKKLDIQLLPCLNEKGELLKIYNLRQKKSLLPVDAVLMAGGKGERLRPLTEKTPKPLLPVGNKTIIDYNVDNLISYGVENIYVITNYLAEQIEQHFEQERHDVKVRCIREKDYLGTIASVNLIESPDNENVLVMNSDLFTNIDYEDFYRYFKEKDADMLAAAIPYSINIPYGIFELEGRNVKNINEKPTYNYYANAGIYLIKKELLKLIPNNTVFNATDFMDLLISKGKAVMRYPLIGYWIDIGNPDEYKKAQDFAKHIEKEND